MTLSWVGSRIDRITSATKRGSLGTHLSNDHLIFLCLITEHIRSCNRTRVQIWQLHSVIKFCMSQISKMFHPLPTTQMTRYLIRIQLCGMDENASTYSQLIYLYFIYFIITLLQLLKKAINIMLQLIFPKMTTFLNQNSRTLIRISVQASYIIQSQRKISMLLFNMNISVLQMIEELAINHLTKYIIRFYDFLRPSFRSWSRLIA